jgi:hypothetical protein
MAITIKTRARKRKNKTRVPRLKKCPGCGLNLRKAFFEAGCDYCHECNRGNGQGERFVAKAQQAQALARAALRKAA